MKSRKEIMDTLGYFMGTEQYHMLSILCPCLLATDGVRYLCEAAECFWLMDTIASYQDKCRADDSLRYMQFWTLRVRDNKGVLICERDTDDVVFTQEFDYTDFPLDEIKIWVEFAGENRWVAMLPSER